MPNYVFSTDLLRTRYIGYLASKYKVVVFMPMIGPEEAKRVGYFHSTNVQYVKWELEVPKFWSIFKLFRIAAMTEFDYLESVRHFYKRPTFKNNWQRRLVRFFAKPFGQLLTADFFTKLESRLHPRSLQFDKYLKQFQPSLVITATPGFNPFEAEMILLAKRSKLPTAAVNFTWDNLTTNCNHIRKTDYLIVWNDIVKEEAKKIHHYDLAKVFVAGVNKFDHYFRKEGKLSREEFLKSKKLDPKRKTIVFCSKPKTYVEQLDHVRGILEAREKGRLAAPVNLLIRPHPLDNRDNYKEFINLPNVYVDYSGKSMKFSAESVSNKIEMDEEDLMNLKYTLQYGDVHLQYGSTLALEAAIFDKPMVNIGFLKTLNHDTSYKVTHFWPVIETGASPIAKTPEELVDLTNQYLKNPMLHKENRRQLLEKFVVLRDGFAYKRNVDFLGNVLS